MGDHMQIEGMQIDQAVTAGPNGVVIHTEIRCRMLYQYQSDRIISYAAMSKIDNVELFLKGERAAEAFKLFRAFWDKTNG